VTTRRRAIRLHQNSSMRCRTTSRSPHRVSESQSRPNYTNMPAASVLNPATLLAMFCNHPGPMRDMARTQCRAAAAVLYPWVGAGAWTGDSASN
jgi:hypothetical protein